MLKVLYRSGSSLSSPDDAQPQLLGAFHFARTSSEATEPDDHSTCQRVNMRVLGGQDVLCESLHASAPLRTGQQDDVHYRCNDSVLFGVIMLEESAFAASDTNSPLQAASSVAYERIFAVLEKEKFPYALRFWNYMANINGTTQGLERYRQFNLGRQQAFAASGQGYVNNLPAACALGTAGGPLTIAFLAGRAPSLPVENPRQISACDYPLQYGPRSPLFSRAGIASIAETRMLFLSGTASIVGHATLHAGDIVAQTEESLTNIAAVLAAAGKHTAAPCELADLDYIVYIRRTEDFASVREVIARRIGIELKAAYVQADICRSDLLVEIEGSAELLPR